MAEVLLNVPFTPIPKTVLTIIITEDLVVRADLTVDKPTPEILAKILLSAQTTLVNACIAAEETYGQAFGDAWAAARKESNAR